MRNTVKIDGIEWDVERAEAGKLRASNQKYPAFEYHANGHAELRRKLPSAFAHWRAKNVNSAADLTEDALYALTRDFASK